MNQRQDLVSECSLFKVFLSFDYYGLIILIQKKIKKSIAPMKSPSHLA